MSKIHASLVITFAILIAACGKPRTRKILLISIDTLRADHLSVYGYSRETPNLDMLAKDSVLYRRAYTNGCWTMPSHISMLTGTLSARHGVNMPWFVREDDTYRALSEEIKTIAELLPLKSVKFAELPGALGFNRGFYLSRDADPFRSEKEYNDLIGLFDQFGKSDFFFFVHTWMVHTPYSDALYFTDDPQVRDYVYHLRETSRTAEADLREFLKQKNEFKVDTCLKLYDGGINRVDREIGRLIDYLKSKNLYDEMLIIVTSDHGENFGDHHPEFYCDHGRDFYEEYVRVPLIVKYPGAQIKGVVEEPVSLIDLSPTILDFCGVDAPKYIQGEILPQPGEESSRVIISEATTKLKDVEHKMILKDGIKLIVKMSDPCGPERMGEIKDYRVYDLKSDPGETKNISGHQHLMNELIEEIYKSASPAGQHTKISEDTKKQLRALGYIQ